MVFEHNYEDFPELTNQQLSEFGFLSPHVQFTEDFEAEVVKVTDGDTLTIKTNSRDFDFPLRLLDIDALELNEGGEVAKEWLKGKIEGSKVMILINSSNRVGKFGRLLGHVLSNGLDVGQEMLHLGLVSKFGLKDEGAIPSFDKLMQEVSL